ncbi:N-acetylmuramoyl-L-alanine amidase [Laspinema olomoucense]|uniref:N-acetylmuramoyl-L-alanine amidase n=1 Tax=Laspinema olomoucense D3b TaxID=2953688 RepID=A0ABT2N9E2_9CYAN|nr:N-acetylmuramoyl-L-alanine amidase [Laspinema sp. D3b]MCT7979312.1 N-acetylmuramoyl-L-alanine amidase [Laspinema sp. D3b]
MRNWVKPQIFSWLLPTATAVFLLAAPAQAARLEYWRFDTEQNRLHFTTAGGVQPKAQLIANPTRLVIDLPGTTLDRSAVTQPVGSSGFQSIRVGQFESDTTRLVIELSPGYTMDPQQVQFRGISPTEWTVDLPTPQRIGAPSSGSAAAAPPARSGSGVQIENVQVTPDGFFIRTRGGQPQVKMEQSSDRSLYVDLPGATISPNMGSRDQLLDRHGVARMSVRPLEGSTPGVRVTFILSDTNSNWQVTASNLGGVVVLPGPQGSRVGSGSVAMAQNPSSDRIVTIERVELQQDGSQILIQSNQPFTYTSEWDRASGAYRIVIPSAQLGNGVQPPQSTNRGAFLWVKLQQEDSQTVAILVQPSAGVRIGPLTQPSPQLLSVTLQRPGNVAAAPNSRTSIPTAPGPMSYPAPSPMRSRDGRRVVVIDPGHGGGDPGAVGIGGIQEKEIVMDISEQVARLLEQNGVQVVMTRQDDREIDLAPRVQLANRVNADIFVSIHANAIDMSRPDVNGIETYYYASGQALAQTIHNSLLQGTGARDRRVRQSRFYVLRHTSMPAVLLEVGFVTGAEDAPRLANAAYRTQLAQAIVQGVLQYLQNP